MRSLIFFVIASLFAGQATADCVIGGSRNVITCDSEDDLRQLIHGQDADDWMRLVEVPKLNEEIRQLRAQISALREAQEQRASPQLPCPTNLLPTHAQ